MTPPSDPRDDRSDPEAGSGGVAHTWATAAARAAATKTDRDTVVLAVGDLLGITEYFVITSGGTGRQVRTLTEEIEAHIADAGGPRPMRIEGLRDLQWVVMDYGAFVVHVFQDETRAFYDLERLWSDAERISWRSTTD